MAFLHVCRQQKIIWEGATVASRCFLITRRLSVPCKLCVQGSNSPLNYATVWTHKNGLLHVFQGQQHRICLSTNNAFPLQQKIAQAHVDLPIDRKQTGTTGRKKKPAKKTKKNAEEQIKDEGQISSKKSAKNDKKNTDMQSAEVAEPSSKTTAKKKKKKQSGKVDEEAKRTSNDKNKPNGKNAADTKLLKSRDQKGKGKVKQAMKKKKQSHATEGDVDKAIAYKKDNKKSTNSVKRDSNKPAAVTGHIDKFKTSADAQGNIINDVKDVNKSKGTNNNSTVLSEEHSLDYNLEVVLAETEDDLHRESELEGAHLSDTRAELGVDGVDTIKSNHEADSKNIHSGEAGCDAGSLEKTSVELVDVDVHAQQQFGGMVQTPKKYREGTAGGRLFKAQTLAEIDGYLYLGKPNQAQKLFNRYLRMGKTFEVDTFNKLLHGWAQKGNLMSVKLLYNLLKQEELEPDVTTYAALLHAYGKFSDSDGIRNVLNEMSEKFLDVKHIFHSCCLTELQAKGVLHALKLLDPHYQPEVPETERNLTYPSLVEPLYSHRPYFNTTLVSVPGELEKELNEERLQNLLEEQISRELSGITNVKSVEEEQLESIEAHKNRKEMFLECRNVWRKALIESLEKELAEIKNAKGNSVHPRYAPFFQAFEPEELADITLDTIVFYVKGRIEGVPLNGVSGAVGSALNTKYIVKHRVQSGMLDKMKGIYHDYFSYLMDEKLTARKMAREFWDGLDNSLPYGASLQQEVPSWPWATKIVFGCALVDCFLKSAMINVNQFNNRPEKILPAFYHTYEFKVNKKFGVLKPHPIVCKLFKGYLASQGEISMETTSVPMLVPPRPWRATKDGAYLILPVELIRSAGDEDGRYDKLLEEKTNKQDLVSVFDSLNFLGACAWKTNQRILDIAIQLFNSGGNEDLAIPGPVNYPKADSKSFKSTTDPEERKKQVRERRIATKLAREQYSLRMSALYKLSVANHFRDQVFWLPINLDFRGRVYPIPPHCAHVGDDLNRGMLQFAKGVPLGERGLDWLKIHLVTLHGAQKKASLKERLEYADKIMDEILDSADNPLTGRCWWKTADDPWQTLATCMEVADAIRCPDPRQFVSHQPVHQDGSCNGLQHYAALGRDRYGAKQVNLVPADRPQDVYEEVAKLVEAARLRDAAAGNEIAKDLEGKVSRKVVKQTVMTIVYGVTFVGGRLQIERQLKDLDMDDKSVFKASTYLVTKVFASIGEMFTAARAIQNWFASSATQIALSGHYVDWYTPLGLYVSQPYSRKAPTKVLKTKLQWMLIKAKGLPHIPPDSRKQRGAFPPNFVHSLDSTHMMLTALFCQRSGATFSSVHDSFWTHAANVDVMNQICREQFLALHSEPVLQELQEHFQKNYSDLKLARPLKLKETGEERTHVCFEGLPEPGDFDIKEVLDSVYFFS